MSRRLFLNAVICLIAISVARADPIIESVQQKLKDQGFYYGEINGKRDADTAAAIRRYQIRNGLQITGELDVETRRSLKVGSATSSTPVPRPASSAPPDRSDLRDDSISDSAVATPPPRPNQAIAPAPQEYEPGSRVLNPDITGTFAGTPFEMAPPDVQQRVLVGAQTLLARRGYYRGDLDGIYGPATEFAIRAHQARIGIPPNGRLDLETLASLGLLPSQRGPGFGPSRHRWRPPRTEIAPNGEPIYIPN